MKAINHPSFSASGREPMADRWCCCGRNLGMYSIDATPSCGDQACDDYLADHPEWYSEDEGE